MIAQVTNMYRMFLLSKASKSDVLYCSLYLGISVANLSGTCKPELPVSTNRHLQFIFEKISLLAKGPTWCICLL